MSTNAEFEFRGINHVALMSSDMARTVDFYSNTLGMPLVRTLELPGGGQHFFFDCGNGDCVAFFWFPESPDHAPGLASAGPIREGAVSAKGSMNHLAFDVSPDKFDEYVEKLRAKDVNVSHAINHDDSESTMTREMHPGVFVRSVYFWDPDGILLEFAAWTKEHGPEDAAHPPANADGIRT